MKQLLWIAAGGATGCVLRYLMQAAIQQAAGPGFPIGTLAVNLLGCLLIGGLAGALAGPLALSEEHRLALISGFLGGFTTFSALGYEAFQLAQTGRWLTAAIYMLGSCGLGLSAVGCGYYLVERWTSGG